MAIFLFDSAVVPCAPNWASNSPSVVDASPSRGRDGGRLFIFWRRGDFRTSIPSRWAWSGQLSSTEFKVSVGQRTQSCPTFYGHNFQGDVIYAFGGRVPLRVLGAIPSFREYRPLIGGEATMRLFSFRNDA